MSGAQPTCEGYDEMWTAILAKVEALKAAAPARHGDSRSQAMIHGDGRGVSAIFSIGMEDGTDTVYHLQAHRWPRTGEVEVSAKAYLDNHDDFWAKELADRKNAAVIRHMHYRVQPDLSPRDRDLAGFGGTLHRIRFHDGRVIETRNLWHQGTIPPAWRDRLPGNAVFLDEYGDPQQPQVKTTWPEVQAGDLVYRPGRRITVARVGVEEDGPYYRVTVEGADQGGKPVTEEWRGGLHAYVCRPETKGEAA